MPKKASELRPNKKYKSSFAMSFMACQLSVSVSGFYDELHNGLSRRTIRFNQQINPC